MNYKIHFTHKGENIVVEGNTLKEIRDKARIEFGTKTEESKIAKQKLREIIEGMSSAELLKLWVEESEFYALLS